MTAVTSLADRFRRLIDAYGPMPVSRFMGESNAVYYASRDPLGAAGDFVTAPDISQMFGELIGLWFADMWARAGQLPAAAFCELGPGRGTLAKDALRAMRLAGLTPAVHLVEASPTLRAEQAKAVPGCVFHDTPASLPETAPLLLIANEFLDALPIRQLVCTSRGWRERMVGLGEDGFRFEAGQQPMDIAVPAAMRGEPEGTIIETCPGAAAIVDDIARRIGQQGGVALFIDYGNVAPRTGSSLQAVRGHRKVDALAFPGEADLTAHVDFHTLATIATKAGCRVALAEQGAWLRALGIDMRAGALTGARPDQADGIRAARDRLVDEDAMGSLFKVMAVHSPQWPEPTGFAP